MTEIAKITAEDAEEYSQSLAQIGEGWWRQIAWAFRQGMHEALGMSRRGWAERYHGYIKLDPEAERKPAVLELHDQGLNNSEIADTLGVGETTVRRDLAGGDESSPFGESPDVEDAEEQEPAEEGSPFGEPGADAQPVEEPVDGAESKSTRDLLAQSDENEWYTPRRFIEAAVEVLGEIDLDPASSATANAIVGAAEFYTIHDDGLTKPWKGTIWLNPPYGGQNRLFIEQLTREYEAGNVSAAVALFNCHPAETAWFQRLFGYTVCFVRGRIDFSGPARERASTSTHGSAVVYLGPDWKRFANTFQRFGSVVRRV